MATTTAMQTDSALTSSALPNVTSVRCALFDGDETLCEIIIGVKKFIAAISILGCSTVIFFIWLFRKYLIFIQRLILYLFIAALLKCISFIMESRYDPGPTCTFQAWTLTYLSWVVLVWNCCITLTLYMTAIRSTTTDRLEWVYHAVSWGLPFIVACLPLFGHHYGPAGLWCWIKNDWGWRFGILYLPLLIILPTLLAAYIYIMVMVNRKSKIWEGLYDPDVERKKKMLREDLKPLRWYPFVHLATWLFPLINRIQNAAHFKPVFGLYILHICSSTSYGTILSITFLMGREMRGLLTKSQIKDAWYTNRSRERNVIQEYDPQPRGDPGGDPQEGTSVAVISATNMSVSDFTSLEPPPPADPPPPVGSQAPESSPLKVADQPVKDYGGETNA